MNKKYYAVGSTYLVGDVTFGKNFSMFHGAAVRGDIAKITFGNNVNVQENATVHVNADMPCEIGNNVSIGHNAVVHSAIIEDNVIVGMGAILLNGCKIGKDTIIGAGSVIGQNKVIPERSIVIGNPFRVLRTATADEIEGITANATEYAELSEKYGTQFFFEQNC